MILMRIVVITEKFSKGKKTNPQPSSMKSALAKRGTVAETCKNYLDETTNKK